MRIFNKILINKLNSKGFRMAEENDKQELETMKIAYEIGKYIQSFYTEDLNDKSAPYSYYSDYWNPGPNQLYNKTKTGLILYEIYESPNELYTPWGKWTVLGGGNISNSDYIMKKMHEELGLVLIKTENELYGTKIRWNQWAITKWKGKKLPEVTGLSHYEYCDLRIYEKKFYDFANSFENTLKKN